MSSHKPGPKKVRLLAARNSNRRVPAWIMQRTNRRFTKHPKSRSWRRTSLKQ